jgi:hypothetical protein
MTSEYDELARTPPRHDDDRNHALRLVDLVIEKHAPALA